MMTRLAIATLAFLALAPVGAADAQTYELRIGTGNARPHPAIAAADFMKEQIEARTDGDVSVTVYTIGQLGTQLDMIENTSLGAIDMVVQITTNAVSIVPDFQIFNFFYLFDDIDAFNAVIEPDGALFEHFEQQVADKLNSRLYTFASGGNRILSNEVRPVETPADLDGMKMRASAPLTQKQWAEFGMTSFPVSFGEQYTALQTGLIEATENSVSATYGRKIPEVAPYVALTNHEIMTLFVMGSDVALGNLPEDYQDIIAEVAREAGPVGTASAAELDQSVLQRLREFPGATITEPDTSAFAERLLPLHDQLAEELGLTGLLTDAREAMGGS